ncbi:unnamed protein product, partial [Meganyctiphanes norvegica]
ACPSGFFMSNGSSQCFKFIPGKVSWRHDGLVNWAGARIICQEEGLQMAMPANLVVAIALRSNLFHTYGEGSHAWLAACGGYSGGYGVGPQMVVVAQQGALANTTISAEDPVWSPGYGEITTGRCLLLRVRFSAIISSPGR